jgi:hypothetical protein
MKDNLRFCQIDGSIVCASAFRTNAEMCEPLSDRTRLVTGSNFPSGIFTSSSYCSVNVENRSGKPMHATGFEPL